METEPKETEPKKTDPAETDPAETDPAETDPAETDPFTCKNHPTMSTTARLANLGAYTLLQLIGVLLLGWDWREIVLLYWLENISLGVAMVVKLVRSARAPGGDDPQIVGELRVNGRLVRGPGAGLALAGFFALHYGIFTLVHGVFVILMIAGVFVPVGSTTGPVNWWGALLVWLLAGAVQVAIAWFGPLPEHRGSRLMFSAYPRMIVLHISVIVGIMLIATLEWPAAAAVLLIALHAVIDGATWMLSAARARHSSRAAQAAEPRG